jgi:hypothetical protein
VLNPADPDEKERGPSGAPTWIEHVWQHLVAKARGGTPPRLPHWFARPAVARHGFTSPALLRGLHGSQQDLPYPSQVKPFNFALTAYVALAGAPEGTDPAKCHLIGPFERDPRRWQNQDWFDTASRTACRITTGERTSGRVARVKSVADIVAEYEAHPESKSAGPDGHPVESTTLGLLRRRHVEPVYFYRIGKESNRYEGVDRGELRSVDEVQEIVENPRATAWDTVYLPLLHVIPARQLAAETGIAESLLIRYKNKLVGPSPRNMKLLIATLRHCLPEVPRVRAGREANPGLGRNRDYAGSIL